MTALFWTVYEEFRAPLRELVEGVRHAAAEAGVSLDDEQIYEAMYAVYTRVRGEG